MGCRGAGVCCASNKQEASKEGAVNATIKDRVFDIRPSSRKRRGDRSRLQAPSPGGRLAQEACAEKRVSMAARLERLRMPAHLNEGRGFFSRIMITT
jgi:hypothetical protein